MIKTLCVVGGFILLLIACSGMAHSQEAPGDLVGSGCMGRPSLSLDRLGLTEDQWILVRRIEQSCDERIQTLQGRLMSRRFELRALFGDALVDGASIRAKAREVLDLQHECRRIAVECQIEIREVLTPEQRRNWSAAEDACVPWSRRSRP